MLKKRLLFLLLTIIQMSLTACQSAGISSDDSETIDKSNQRTNVQQNEETQREIENITVDLTTVKDLQSIIDNAEEFDVITLTGECKGNPGDVVCIDKSLVFYGYQATLTNIIFEVNTDNQIWIDGIQFDGTSETNHAIHIINAGADSAVVRCTFKDQKEDAVVIDKIVDGVTFMVAENNFSDYGLSKTKIDGAITLNFAEKIYAIFEIFDNNFFLTKDVGIENPSHMDVTLKTVKSENSDEVYQNTFVKFLGNTIQKGENEVTIDLDTEIPERNFNFKTFK